MRRHQDTEVCLGILPHCALFESLVVLGSVATVQCQRTEANYEAKRGIERP